MDYVLASASKFKGPVGSLCHRCPQCSATGPQLLRCAGCRAVRYCSREHQVADRPLHKSICTKIRKIRDTLVKEEALVRNNQEEHNGEPPANASETHPGRFWGLQHTQEYMTARFELAVKHLVELGTLDSVREALEHMQDTLRLGRSDDMGLREFVPFNMLRLDLDQECYDFVKWWETCGLTGTYDWADMTLPYLDIHGADVLEEPDFLLHKSPTLRFVLVILLLKLKLIVDICNIKTVRSIAVIRSIPYDVRALIEAAVVRSPLSTMFTNQTDESLLETEELLLDQIRQLGAAVTDANQHFMFNLFKPDEALCERLQAYSSGSWEEMAFAMQQSYPVWWETEGVLDLLNDARKCAVRDSKDEIEDMVKKGAFKSGRGPRQTTEEILTNVSINRVWEYVAWAVENASYLGSWSNRPSEGHTLQLREMRKMAEEENKN